MEKQRIPTKAEILKQLGDRGVSQKCPRCNKANLGLIDGYFNHPLQPGPDGMMLGGPSIPSLITFCPNCGYLCQHALGALGFLSDKEADNDGK